MHLYDRPLFFDVCVYDCRSMAFRCCHLTARVWTCFYDTPASVRSLVSRRRADWTGVQHRSRSALNRPTSLTFSLGSICSAGKLLLASTPTQNKRTDVQAQPAAIHQFRRSNISHPCPVAFFWKILLADTQ